MNFIYLCNSLQAPLRRQIVDFFILASSTDLFSRLFYILVLVYCRVISRPPQFSFRLKHEVSSPVFLSVPLRQTCTTTCVLEISRFPHFAGWLLLVFALSTSQRLWLIMRSTNNFVLIKSFAIHVFLSRLYYLTHFKFVLPDSPSMAPALLCWISISAICMYRPITLR